MVAELSHYDNYEFSQFLNDHSLSELSLYSKQHKRPEERKKINELVQRFFEESERYASSDLYLKASFLLQSDSKISDEFISKHILKADRSLVKEAIQTVVEEDDRWRVDRLRNWGIDLNEEIGNSQTALHVACKKGNGELIIGLLKQGANPNILDKNGNSPLHLYCARRDWIDPTVIKILYKAGALINRPNEIGETPLHKASDLNHWEAVERLIKLGADVNSDTYVETPLHLALRKSQMDIGEKLIKDGADPFALDSDDKTPLQLLCENHGENEALRLIKLISKETGLPPLAVAIKSNHPDLIRLYAKQEKYPQNVQDVLDNAFVTGRPALFAAYDRDNRDMDALKFLVKQGIPLDQTNDKGETFLHHLVMKKNLPSELVDLLIQNSPLLNQFKDASTMSELTKYGDVRKILLRKSKLFERDDFGNAPIHDAIRSRVSPVTLEILITSGALVNQLDPSKNTALHLAVAMRPPDLENIKILIERGAKLNLKNANGLTPLHLAVLNSKASDSLIEYLINQGADLEIANPTGITPLWLINNFERKLSIPTKNREYEVEFSLRSSLAQFWNLKWHTQLEDQTVVLDGMIGGMGMTKAFGETVAGNLFEKFVNHPKQSHSLALAKKEIDKSIENTKKDIQEVQTLINRNEPLSFNSGWRGHMVNVSIVGDYLLIGNVGQFRKTEPIRVYKIDRKQSQLTDQDIELFRTSVVLSPEQGRDFFYNILPKKLGYDETKQDDLIENFIHNTFKKRDQNMGNCWWKGPLLGMFGVMLLTQLNDPKNTKTNQETFDEVQQFYKQFTEYTHIEIAREYMKMPRSKIEPDHELVKTVIGKVKNKRWRHLFEEGNKGPVKPLFKKSDFFQEVEQYKKTYKLNDEFAPI